MKMTKRLVFATLVCIPLAFAACGGGDEADSKKAAQQEQKGGQDEVPKKAPASSGDIGDYSFSINNYTLTSDYDGNPAIIVDFDFTNNGEETTSFMSAAHAKAFQDGVQLEVALIMNADVYNSENSMKEIKTGATLNVQEAWVLTSESSPVEVELEEFLSFSDEKLEKTFEIAE